MRAKRAEQERARQLRREGCSLREIAEEVDSALSSVSVWVRDIERESLRVSVETRSLGPSSDPNEPRRHCSRCDSELPVSAFNRSGDGYQWWCRECFRSYFRARGQLHRDQTAAALRRRREAGQKYVEAVKRRSVCADCGISEPVVLDFDHIGSKRAEISKLTAEGASIATIKTEIGQCEVVCAICHRRRTARRGNWRRAASPWWRSKPPRGRERARNLAYIYSLLERSSCVDCGLVDMVVLEFDHVGAKKASVLRMASDGVSLANLEAEVSRCETRCVNCHRLRTSSQRPGWRPAEPRS